MLSVPLSKLKASLSRYLARVRAGEEVILTNRGIPVARLAPLRPDDPHESALADLVRTGQLRAPKKRKLPRELVQPPGILVDPKGAVLAGFLRDRNDGP